MTDNEIQRLAVKAKLLGILKVIPTYCKHEYYLISKDKKNHLLLIPSNVTVLNEYISFIPFTKDLDEVRGNLKVIGGKGLTDISKMFRKCNLDMLDLSELDTSQVVYMRHMFVNANIAHINLRGLDTRNVKTMEGMFNYCKTGELDFSSFDISKLLNMRNMFSGCETPELDLSSFGNSRVNTIEGAFKYCKTGFVNLCNFNSSEKINILESFAYSSIKEIDLSKFNPPEISNILWTFNKCNAHVTTHNKHLLKLLQR